MPTTDSAWRDNRRLTLLLFLLWLIPTFTVIFFARELNHWTLFGWPVSFYMAAQGLTLLYVVIVAIYAWRMNRADAVGTYVDTDDDINTEQTE